MIQSAPGPSASSALSHIAAGLTQRLGFQFAPQPEFAELASAYGHVLWRMQPAPAQVALEVVVLCDRASAPQDHLWQREHFLRLGAACDRLATPGTFGLVDRYRRFTVVEIGAGSQSPEDEARLRALRSDATGVTLVESAYVDAASGTVWSGAGLGANLANTVMMQAETPADWIRGMLAMPRVSGFAPPMPDAHPEGPPLFSANAIALSSFFASPLAGGVLVAWNLQRTRRVGAAVGTVVASFVFTTLFLLFAIYTDLPGAIYTGISIGCTLGLRAVAVKLFPATRNAASPWLAVLVCLGSVVAVVGLCVGIAFTIPESKVELGNGCSALYEGGATKEDAQKVGAYLVEKGHLAKDVQIRVAKPAGDIKIFIAVKDGAWNKPDVIAAFQDVASAVVKDVYPGKTVHVVLTSDFGVEQRTLTAH